ncbi:MAG: peptidylprolyl isomerase [Polyangiaceae bacterium]
MSDELPKKVFSVPPPVTDEIDSEWGMKAATPEKPKTATEAADEGVAPASVSTPPAAAATAAAPSSRPPPPASEDEDDAEDEDDEDDDDDDEDDDAHPVVRAGGHGATGRTTPTASGDDWIPDWGPWAMLAALVLIGVAGGLGAFTKPPAEGEAQATSTPVEASKPTSIEASHFLVMYKGSMRAPATVTRTKEEAKARALEGLAKLKKGADFAKIVGEYSDEPGAAARGGALGSFTPDRMVKPFADAAFALKVGQVSGLVETDFGYHVIKRTK